MSRSMREVSFREWIYCFICMLVKSGDIGPSKYHARCSCIPYDPSDKVPLSSSESILSNQGLTYLYGTMAGFLQTQIERIVGGIILIQW